MKDIFREHIFRLCQVDSWRPSIENATAADKLLLRVEQICDLVEKSWAYIMQISSMLFGYKLYHSSNKVLLW